ncbi:MAG: Nif11-like leader peptide family RiPP precursor [Lachnospiraceae bacterium]|nr:Nif11-like leader peptide family RiPP precursor [Lachnospiraceae bacterium]
MNENIKKFLEKLSNDPEAIAKMSAIRDPEEAYQLASSMQDGFTKEEFISVMEAFRESGKPREDLSDEDLMKVAGGADVWEVIYTVESAVIASGLAAGLAAI